MTNDRGNCEKVSIFFKKNHTPNNKKTVPPIPHGSFTSAGSASASMVFASSRIHAARSLSWSSPQASLDA